MTPDGVPVYKLDVEGKRWVPLIPDDLKASLPEGAEVKWLDGRWQIVGPDGKALYAWDFTTHTWTSLAAGPGETETSEACKPPLPPRLSVGHSARALVHLNVRRTPGIGNNRITTIPPGTVVQVIGGPKCVPYKDSAYMWWNIRLPDGRTGWAAEAALHGEGYYMEPVD